VKSAADRGDYWQPEIRLVPPTGGGQVGAVAWRMAGRKSLLLPWVTWPSRGRRSEFERGGRQAITLPQRTYTENRAYCTKIGRRHAPPRIAGALAMRLAETRLGDASWDQRVTILIGPVFRANWSAR